MTLDTEDLRAIGDIVDERVEAKFDIAMQQVAAGFQEVHDKFDKVDARFDAVDRKIDTVSEDVQTVKRVQAAEVTRSDAMEGQLKKFRAVLRTA